MNPLSTSVAKLQKVIILNKADESLKNLFEIECYWNFLYFEPLLKLQLVEILQSKSEGFFKLPVKRSALLPKAIHR